MIFPGIFWEYTEFDNPWFGFQPDLYVKAYRKIANALESIPGLHFVWHSWAAPRREPLESFYPGDAYVDWVGVSVFQQVYDDKYKGANSGTISDIEEVLHFASSRNKVCTEYNYYDQLLFLKNAQPYIFN